MVCELIPIPERSVNNYAKMFSELTHPSNSKQKHTPQTVNKIIHLHVVN